MVNNFCGPKLMFTAIMALSMISLCQSASGNIAELRSGGAQTKVTDLTTNYVDYHHTT